VAREAAMQSRAAWLPSVTRLVDFPAVSARPGAALADLGDGEPPSLGHRLVLVGPEGGWDDDESAAGLPRVRLGANVLRAETAAVAAGAIWTALRAGLVAAACGDTP
jgi:16S rRNA (uracil1498-N3)-methyltransferase